MENALAVHKKTKNKRKLPYDPAYSTLNYIPKSIENRYSNKYKLVHSSTDIVTNRYKQPKCPWTEEETIFLYTYNGILFSREKEHSIDTCYNREPPKHYVKWKKPDIKGHVLYDFTYMKYPELLSPYRYNTDRLLSVTQGRGMWGGAPQQV